MPDTVCTVLDSWWWTERLSETCKVLFQSKINLRYCASGWFYYRNILWCTVPQNSNFFSMFARGVWCMVLQLRYLWWCCAKVIWASEFRTAVLLKACVVKDLRKWADLLRYLQKVQQHDWRNQYLTLGLMATKIASWSQVRLNYCIVRPCKYEFRTQYFVCLLTRRNILTTRKCEVTLQIILKLSIPCIFVSKYIVYHIN